MIYSGSNITASKTVDQWDPSANPCVDYHDTYGAYWMTVDEALNTHENCREPDVSVVSEQACKSHCD